MQVLQINVTVNLIAGAVIPVPHGLQTADGRPLVPNFVMPNQATPIGVVTRTDTTVTFQNPDVNPQAAIFTILCDHTIQKLLTDPTATIWRGNLDAPAPTPAVTAYGEIWVNNGVTNQVTNAVAGVHDLITAFNTPEGNNGLALNCTNDKANNRVRADVAGTFMVQLNISFSGSANQRYHVEVGVNGVLQPNLAAERTLGGAGDTGTLAAQGYAALLAGDLVDLWVECGGAAKNFLVGHANLSLLRIGV